MILPEVTTQLEKALSDLAIARSIFDVATEPFAHTITPGSVEAVALVYNCSRTNDLFIAAEEYLHNIEPALTNAINALLDLRATQKRQQE